MVSKLGLSAYATNRIHSRLDAQHISRDDAERITHAVNHVYRKAVEDRKRERDIINQERSYTPHEDYHPWVLHRKGRGKWHVFYRGGFEILEDRSECGYWRDREIDEENTLKTQASDVMVVARKDICKTCLKQPQQVALEALHAGYSIPIGIVQSLGDTDFLFRDMGMRGGNSHHSFMSQDTLFNVVMFYYTNHYPIVVEVTDTGLVCIRALHAYNDAEALRLSARQIWNKTLTDELSHGILSWSSYRVDEEFLHPVELMVEFYKAINTAELVVTGKPVSCFALDDKYRVSSDFVLATVWFLRNKPAKIHCFTG